MTRKSMVFALAILASIPLTFGANYSTEAVMSLQKEEGIYNVAVKISELSEKGGKVTERIVSEPRLRSALGVAATLYVGPNQSQSEYKQQENVTVDVTWPYPNEPGTASCSVVVKRGDTTLSKSKFQLQVDGPGRVPLVLSDKDVEPTSVKVADEKMRDCVFLELAGKTKPEVKKLAIENYGNKVQIRDAQGNLTEAGLAFGVYHETGLTLQCKNQDEAKRVAAVLQGKSGD